jgi:hypothetical protein
VPATPAISAMMLIIRSSRARRLYGETRAGVLSSAIMRHHHITRLLINRKDVWKRISNLNHPLNHWEIRENACSEFFLKDLEFLNVSILKEEVCGAGISLSV